MTRRLVMLALLAALVAPLPARADTLRLAPASTELPPGMTGGGLAGAVRSFRGDASVGGIAMKLLGTLISGGVKGHEMHVGAGIGVISAAKEALDPAFLLGNIPGGLIGGALGAAIPLPGVLAELGLGGEMLGFAPPLLGAMFGSAFAMQAWDLARDHRLTLSNLEDRVDVKSLLAQSAGVDAMIILARHALPALMLGPVNFTEVGAALLGGYLAARIFDALRSHQDRRSSSTLATGLQGPSPAPRPSDTAWLTDRLDAAYRAYIAAQKRADAPATKAAYAEYVALAQALHPAH